MRMPTQGHCHRRTGGHDGGPRMERQMLCYLECCMFVVMHDTARFIPSATALTAGQRRLARAGFAVFLLVGAVQGLYGPVLPAVRASFGLTTAAGGWVVGTHFFGSVAGVLLSFVLEARLQPRTRLTIGLMLVAVGTVAFALIRAWPWALGGVLCIGLGYGILVVAVNALFAASFGNRSTALLILVNAGFGLGAVFGPLLYGIFSSGNFRLPFLVAGALAVLGLPLGWVVPETPLHERHDPAPAGRGVQLALGGFIALLLLYTALESDVSGWMATHLIFHGYSQGAAAELTAAFWMALTVGRLLSVPISLQLKPLQMIAGALLGVIVLALVARLSTLTAVAYVLIGLLLAPIFPVGFAWMHQTFPRLRGAASMAMLGGLGGGLIFPVLVGRVIEASTPDVLPLALAAIAVACVMVSLSLPGLIKAGR